MGGGEEDPQKLKRIAAAAYVYDNDPRWADYWSNVLIPPHLASRKDVVNHFKQKFYQRYIDPELIVEPIGTTSTSQPARTPTPPPESSSSPSNANTRQRGSGSSSRTSGSSAPTPPGSTSLRWDQQTIQFSVNAWVFIVAVLAIFPLVPQNLSKRAYRLSFLGTACTSVYSLYSLYGKPRAWNLPAFQMWFQTVVVTKDFIYSLYCVSFLTSHLCLKCQYLFRIWFLYLCVCCLIFGLLSSKSTLVSYFILDSFSDTHTLSCPRACCRSTLYRKYLEEACVWVESNATTLSIMSSQSEIGTGFLLIISLFTSQRNIIQAFMYWQLLKLMYHAPATAGYHQSVWAKIGRAANPLIQRFAPFLDTPISASQKWWFR